MKIAIITSGFLPVPATKGGAVENLIVNILKENEKRKKMKFVVFSIYDENSMIESQKYQHTKFTFIKSNVLIKFLDKIMFFIAKKILKKQNSQSYRYIFQRLYFLNICSKNLKKENYDKIILENHPTQYLALKWRKNYIKYSGKYYYHCHNEFPGTYGCLKIIKNTEKIMCVSQYIAETLSNYLDMNKNKFYVLRNCIDYDKFSSEIGEIEKNKIRKKYNIKNNEKVLIFTGRIVPEKGVMELVRALENLKYKKNKLIIIGSALNKLKINTNYQIKIEKMIKKLKNKIIFTGFISYDEIYKYYSIADIAVLPSIWNDPAPLTIIESLISGLPIVTTNSGGIPEYATNGSAVILNKDNNLINSLTQTLDDLLINEKKLELMSKKAKEVSSDLRLENYYHNFLKIMMS